MSAASSLVDQECPRQAARRDPAGKPPERYNLLTFWPADQAVELPPDPDLESAAVKGRSVPVGTLRYPCGAGIGVLLLTSYRRYPGRDVAAVPIDGRWITLEIV